LHAIGPVTTGWVEQGPRGLLTPSSRRVAPGTAARACSYPPARARNRPFQAGHANRGSRQIIVALVGHEACRAYFVPSLLALDRQWNLGDERARAPAEPRAQHHPQPFERESRCEGQVPPDERPCCPRVEQRSARLAAHADEDPWLRARLPAMRAAGARRRRTQARAVPSGVSAAGSHTSRGELTPSSRTLASTSSSRSPQATSFPSCSTTRATQLATAGG
jgi:hypothetical protein